MGRLGILAPFPFWHLLDLSPLASYMQVLPLAWSHVPNLGPGHLTAGLPLPFLLTTPASCISTLQSNTLLLILSSFLVIQFRLLFSLKIPQQFPILIFFIFAFQFLNDQNLSSVHPYQTCLFKWECWQIQQRICIEKNQPFCNWKLSVSQVGILSCGKISIPKQFVRFFHSFYLNVKEEEF